MPRVCSEWRPTSWRKRRIREFREKIDDAYYFSGPEDRKFRFKSVLRLSVVIDISTQRERLGNLNFVRKPRLRIQASLLTIASKICSSEDCQYFNFATHSEETARFIASISS